MSTQSPVAKRAELDDLALQEADATAVLERFASGGSLDPVVVARVHAQAEQITEGIRLSHGLIDDHTFQSLLDDEA